jgi:hypothetical protein
MMPMNPLNWAALIIAVEAELAAIVWLVWRAL